MSKYANPDVFLEEGLDLLFSHSVQPYMIDENSITTKKKK